MINYAWENLPELNYDEWESSRTTLHLYAQMVGKALLKLAIRRNHWWHATFKVSPRGLVSDPFPLGGGFGQFEFDLAKGAFRVLRSGRGERAFALETGLSVSDFYGSFVAAAAELDISVGLDIPEPYDHPSSIPFEKDSQHAGYEGESVSVFFEILSFSSAVLEEFASGFSGKRSPVQLFWHHLDLAVNLYSGASLGSGAGMNTSSRDAFSHEVFGAGFKSGDQFITEPYFFAYIFPADETLFANRLSDPAAYWSDKAGMYRAILPYHELRRRNSFRADLLSFLRNSYEIMAAARHWDTESLKYSP